MQQVMDAGDAEDTGLSEIHGQILTIGECFLAGAIASLQTLKLYQKEDLGQNRKMGDRHQTLTAEG